MAQVSPPINHIILTDASISYKDDAEGFRAAAKGLDLEIVAELAEGAVQLSGDVRLTELTFSSDCDETFQTDELKVDFSVLHQPMVGTRRLT